MRKSIQVVYGHSSARICGGAMWWCYRKSRDPLGFPWKGGVRACATGSCTIYTCIFQKLKRFIKKNLWKIENDSH